MRELLPFISRIKGEGETGSITMTLKREEDCNVMCAKKKKKKKKKKREIETLRRDIRADPRSSARFEHLTAYLIAIFNDVVRRIRGRIGEGKIDERRQSTGACLNEALPAYPE